MALAIPIALLTMLGAPTAAALANTYFVSNGNDSGPGSLRAAITAANTNPGADTITLATGVGQLTINLNQALPRIGQEVIVNFNEGNPDTPIIINAGFNPTAPIPNGLVLAPGSDRSTVEGVGIEGASSAGLLVQSLDNGIYYYLGHSDGKHGLVIQSSNNTVANSTVTGSTGGGIQVQPPSGGTASGNIIVGNTIGTDSAGDTGLGNLGGGILLQGNASGNAIGGSAAGDGNLISGNGLGGVILQGTGAANNLVEGNMVGLTKDGSGALPNTWGGIVKSGASNDTFTSNTISGNTDGGLMQSNAQGIHNRYNLIGPDASGTFAIPNKVGVEISHDTGDSITGNTISGNGSYGVLFIGGGENTLQGNTIGTTPSSSAALPNQFGVGVRGGAVNDTFNLNTVADNTKSGFVLSGTGTSGNQLLGNFIGTDPAGDALGNGGDGILLNGGATMNTIGGNQGNQIAFNTAAGVVLSGSTTTGDALFSNLIFASGPNRSGPGIQLIGGADGNQGPPVIDSVSTVAGMTQITGTGVPSGTVQAFGNGSCSDPEGKTLLGTAHPDAGGSWSMLVPVVQTGTGVTAAQVTPNSNTSPFSACVTAP